jgi:hypothetical protein
MINRSPISKIKSFSESHTLSKIYSIRMDRTEQRYVMKFLCMDRRKYKAIQTELSRVLKGHAVSVDVCKCWCRKFKARDFSMDGRVRPVKPPIAFSGAIMSLLSEEPFLSARVLTARFSSTHQTIKWVLVSDLGMRKFVRRWIPHDLSEANRRERVLKANLLPEELRADEGNEFANTMTGDESWFCLSYALDFMFATLTFDFRSGYFRRPAAGLP